MSDNLKLPPRKYFRLSQAAKELGCDADYLIHIGSIGAVKIMAAPPPGVFLRVRAISAGGGITSTTILDWTMMSLHFLVIMPGDLRIIEQNGEIEISNVEDEWPKNSSPLRELVGRGLANNSIQGNVFYMIDAHHSPGDFDKWESPPDGERIGFLVKPEQLWISGDEVERLKRGEAAAPAREIPPEIERLFKEPNGKGRNSYLQLIDALCQALTQTDLTESKSAEAVLSALAKAGVAAPVGAKAISQYLKAARELRDPD